MNDEIFQLALHVIPLELWHTLYMVFCSTFIALFFGLPLGTLLALTSPGHLRENRLVYKGLGWIVNIGRSFPFAILMVAIIPFTRFLIGTSLGTTAAIVPLSIAAIPFVARLVEAALKEVDKGLIEAAVVMGSSTSQTIFKVLLPEALPSLILGITTTMINLVGYSAMAGTMGGGGLGKIAIQYGYQRFNFPIMMITVILLIIIVQLIQSIGQFSSHYLNRKRAKGFVHD